MSSVHSYMLWFLFTNLLIRNQKKSQLLIWVEAAASVALVELLIVVYWTPCWFRHCGYSAVLLFSAADELVIIKSMFPGTRERAFVFIYIRNNQI